jgi:hypothetical protein
MLLTEKRCSFLQHFPANCMVRCGFVILGAWRGALFGLHCSSIGYGMELFVDAGIIYRCWSSSISSYCNHLLVSLYCRFHLHSSWGHQFFLLFVLRSIQLTWKFQPLILWPCGLSSRCESELCSSLDYEFMIHRGMSICLSAYFC